MVEVPQADELALHQLEQALYDRRRPISERRMRALASAEVALEERLTLPTEQATPLLPVHPPLTWRGASEQDRYFRSLTLYPLRAQVSWTLPTPGSGRAAALKPPVVEDPAPRGRWGPRLLMTFELLAALVLLVVVAQLYQNTRLTNQPVLAAPTLMAQATPLPTAEAAVEVAAVVELPGGHAPPSDQAQEPADASRAQVALTSPPTPGPQTARRIEIARIQVDAPIVAGDAPENLMMGVGQRLGSADPGQPGNMVVSAHNDIYGQIFRDLDKLAPGDEVLVYTDQGPYRYVVNTVEIVAPTRVDVLAPTDYGRLTMITCYPYLIDTHRVVVVADLVE